MYFDALILLLLVVVSFFLLMVVRYLMRIDSKIGEMRGFAARDEKSIQKEIIIYFLIAGLVWFLLYNLGKFAGLC